MRLFVATPYTIRGFMHHTSHCRPHGAYMQLSLAYTKRAP